MPQVQPLLVVALQLSVRSRSQATQTFALSFRQRGQADAPQPMPEQHWFAPVQPKHCVEVEHTPFWSTGGTDVVACWHTIGPPSVRFVTVPPLEAAPHG